ncbi:hypothetical protein ACTXT7_012826 [Hymenolepis weldensis]
MIGQATDQSMNDGLFRHVVICYGYGMKVTWRLRGINIPLPMHARAMCHLSIYLPEGVEIVPLPFMVFSSVQKKNPIFNTLAQRLFYPEPL